MNGEEGTALNSRKPRKVGRVMESDKQFGNHHNNYFRQDLERDATTSG